MEGCPYSINNCDEFYHQWSTKLCNVAKYDISTVATLNTVKDYISRYIWIPVDVCAKCKRGVIALLVDVVVLIM